jgi:uncharacterized protein (TIGR02678 family)
MNTLEILLENYWILKSKDRDLYYQVKDSIQEYEAFLLDKVGYRLIVNPILIKLEKIPGKPEPWMGIQDFDQPLDYAFLCYVLAFLEDKSQGEQFILSEITDYIQSAWQLETAVDWTIYNQRRSLVKVLKFVRDMNLLLVNDGNESRFINSIDADVLYESTGISRYFMRAFTGSLTDYSSWQDIHNGEWMDVEKDRGKVRRNRVYRRLLMSPAIYSEGSDDPDWQYIKNYRNMIQKDMVETLAYDLHVHKNCAFVIVPEGPYYKGSFPANNSLSDIVLQMNRMIRSMVDDGEIIPDADETILVSGGRFDGWLEKLRKVYAQGWSKEYREMSLSGLRREVLAIMRDYGMVEWRREASEIRMLPMCGKLYGRYPKEFEQKIGINP